MKGALLRSQLETTGPLRSVQTSLRIVLLKDGKSSVYPLALIPTAQGLPTGNNNFPHL